jgi:hypothetical protein
MNQKTVILSILVVALLIGCNNDQEKTVQINPLDELEQVDKLLSEIAKTPQILTAPTDKKTTVTGAEGTIIHVDPSRLETVDGSPLRNSIEIELLEMTDISSMILNNTQTVSNGQILVTGGAYYLNMTSDGKQLKMKQGKGLEVEFPRLTENEMGLFLGERDNLGQIFWTPTNTTFRKKYLTLVDSTEFVKQTKPIKLNSSDNRVLYLVFEDLTFPELLQYDNVRFRVNDDCEFNPEEAKNYWYDVNIDKSNTKGEYIITLNGFDNNGQVIHRKYEATPALEGQDYEKAMRTNKDKYDKIIERQEVLKSTYESVELMNFGWVNCDRFLNDPNPKTNIQLIVKNDSLTGARMYAIFTDINSIMSTQYWRGMKDTASFVNIPSDKKLKIIALSAKDKTPYYFETTINTTTERKVYIDFMPTTQEEVRENIKRIN